MEEGGISKREFIPRHTKETENDPDIKLTKQTHERQDVLCRVCAKEMKYKEITMKFKAKDDRGV